MAKKMFSPKIRNTTSMSALTTSTLCRTFSLVQQGCPDGNGKSKTNADDTILNAENLDQN